MNKTANNKISAVSFWLLMAINALWIVRYGLRVGLAPMLVALVIYLAANWLLVSRYQQLKALHHNSVYIAAGVVFVLLSFAVSRLVDLSTLNVDRWEIIQVFWQAVADGQQPYTAQAHNGNYPGPLPIYFVMCYPFHTLGLNWLMPVLAAAILWYMGWKGTAGMNRVAVYLLMLSPSIYYEVFTLSTIYINAVVFLLWFLWASSKSLKSTSHMLLTAVVGGVVMCTRQIFVVIVAIYALSLLAAKRETFSRLLLWGLVMIMSWIICFLPIVLQYGWDSFATHNPFVVQDEGIFRFKYALLFAIGILACGLMARRRVAVAFCSGLMLAAFPFASIIYYLFATEGTLFTMTDPPSDITYTIFSIPFFLYCLYNHDKE